MKTILATILVVALGALCAAPAMAADVSVSVHGPRGSVSYTHRDYHPNYRYHRDVRPYVRVRHDRRPVYVPAPRYDYPNRALAPAYVNPYLEPKCIARNIDGELYWYYC